MGSLARRLALLMGSAALTFGLAAPAPANEVAASISSSGSGIRILRAEEVLRDYCSSDANGTLWLRLPGGQSFELVTSTTDPAIANPGDGAFHPFDESEVQAALDGVRFPLDHISMDVYLLPFPHRGALDSGAGPGLILLSPGVAPMSASRQQAEFVHELGHVVQYRWLPDRDPRWSEYRSTRGIEDLSIYSANAIHANRPHEIFAEDFRALFGGALATYSGSIENSSIAYPTGVRGLESFLRALPEGGPGAARLLASANPARGAVSFAFALATESPIDLIDVGGRRVATLRPAPAGAQTIWRWDGRDDAGRRIPPGVLLARVRGQAGAVVRISWLP